MSCDHCNLHNPVIVRPKNGLKMCKGCFFELFELDVHETIIKNDLFTSGEKVVLGVSGGKDSTVLAYVMNLLNKRYSYGIDFHLVCVDEGIKGYRDHSLESVKQNKKDFNLELEIVSFKELFNLTMDEVMKNKKLSSCTYCGVFRRQALEEGAKRIDAVKIVTGHNADDMAETVMLNLLRGDFNRLKRCTLAKTKSNNQKNNKEINIEKNNKEVNIEEINEGCGCTKNENEDISLVRVKPFKYIYEKEIVFYAHLKGLKYFSTECIYSHGAYRGYARTFLRAIDPKFILNVIESGEFLQRSDTSSKVSRCLLCSRATSSRAGKCKACVLLESLKEKT